jgi:hypothetical protein
MVLREISVFRMSSLSVLGWSIPIAVTSLLSQLVYLAEWSWSSWLDSIPVWLLRRVDFSQPTVSLLGDNGLDRYERILDRDAVYCTSSEKSGRKDSRNEQRW